MINEHNCKKNCESYKNGVCDRDQIRPFDLDETILAVRREGLAKICNRSNWKIPIMKLMDKGKIDLSIKKARS